MKEDIRRLVAQLPEDNADYAIMKIEPDYENEDCKQGEIKTTATSSGNTVRQTTMA